MKHHPKENFMKKAIALAREGMRKGLGGPFGALVVKEGNIIAESCNQVLHRNDPTAHAEMMAIRNACEYLNDFQLTGCDLYTSCEPCPMCLGAIYWARPERVFYGALHSDAAMASFDDQFIYEELKKEGKDRKIPMLQMLREEAIPLFDEWNSMEQKTPY